MPVRAAWTLLFLAACHAPAAEEDGEGEGSGVPTGSATVLASADGGALYVAHADEGVVSRYDVASGAVASLDVGGEPTRITRLGGRILVTLRAERAIAVLEDEGGALAWVETVATGTEPLGIVASADGAHVYVALSTQDEVDELDADLALVRRFAVPGRPSWLALHPSGETLYVGAAVGGTLSWIDTTAAAPMPAAVTFPELVGAGPAMDAPFARRLTGDPAFDAAGARLAVPGLWVDDVSVPHGHHDDGDPDPGARYESLGLGLSPNNPGIALFDVDAAGRPLGGRVVYAVGFAERDDPEVPLVVRSYLASAGFSPDGALLVGAMEASESVMVLSADPAGMADGAGGFTTSPLAVVATGEGPRGVAFVGEDEAYVHTFLDRAVADLGLAEARALVEAQLAAGEATEATLGAGAAVTLADATLDPVVEEGRRFFYAANDPKLVTPSAGLSCSSCHFEGRNDGLTWPVDTGIRQTPSLAGPVSLSAPFTWTANVASVAEECRITSQERLGGEGITAEELDALAAYVDFTREADHPLKGATSAAIDRGRALFARPDVGCAGCHAGARLTDHAAHDLFDLVGVDTPSLVGIAATAPYLHDGRALTLRDVLDLARAGAMGDTSALSDADMDDLEAYLRSL